MVKQVPILNFQNSIFCLQPNLYVIKESPNQIEVVIYTQKSQKRKSKSGGLDACLQKVLKSLSKVQFSGSKFQMMTRFDNDDYYASNIPLYLN